MGIWDFYFLHARAQVHWLGWNFLWEYNMTSASYFLLITCLRSAKFKKSNSTSRPYNVTVESIGMVARKRVPVQIMELTYHFFLLNYFVFNHSLLSLIWINYSKLRICYSITTPGWPIMQWPRLSCKMFELGFSRWNKC